MSRYHVFTNDVSPNGFSCYCHVEADSRISALDQAVERVKRFAPVTVLAIPEGEVSESFVEGSGRNPGGLRPVVGVFNKYGRVITRAD